MTDTTPPVPPGSGPPGSPPPGSPPPGQAPLPLGDDDRWMLSAHLDGELSDTERAALEAQLDASPEWRAELVEVQVARDAVRSLDLRVAPVGFWDQVEAVVGATPDADPGSAPAEAAAPVVALDEQRDRRRSRRKVLTWAAGGVAAAVVFGAMFVIPGRHQVRPNVAAVVTRHGATSAGQGDPISGLVPLAPMRSSR